MTLRLKVNQVHPPAPSSLSGYLPMKKSPPHQIGNDLFPPPALSLPPCNAFFKQDADCLARIMFCLPAAPG